MRFLFLIPGLLFLICAQPVTAKIFKWVDENGTIHFSDQPDSEDAKEVELRETGIKLHKPENRGETEDIQKTSPASTGKSSEINTSKKKQEDSKSKNDQHIISEDDYKITASVGELGADVVSISGRIGSGPKCENMIITATAKSDTGLSATITERVSKTNSYGSVVFKGAAKASGSADDFGFWDVDTVKIICEDQ